MIGKKGSVKGQAGEISRLKERMDLRIAREGNGAKKV